MNLDDLSAEVMCEVYGSLGVVTLNRPEKLNALNLDMIRIITAALRRWRYDAEVSAVLFCGAGDRAFCAGGDLRAMYDAGMDFRRGLVDLAIPMMFFAEEYALNKLIFEYSKPTISLMNGITMGGGFGIAGHCDFKIACDKTVFAMPETAIGLFPDVGSMYHLTRIQEPVGRYLALTGTSLKGAEVFQAGISSHFIAPAETDSFLKECSDILSEGAEARPALLKYFDKNHKCPQMDQRMAKTKQCADKYFAQRRFDSIRDGLQYAQESFAQEVFEVLQTRSPTSLAVTLQHFNSSVGEEFESVIETDYTLVRNFLRGHDLYEGVRAVIIDKDDSAQWEPGDIEAVTTEMVRTYFENEGYFLADVGY